MAEFPDRLAGKATFLTTQLAVHARRLATEAFDRAGARSYHYRVLAALDQEGALSQADLGRLVNMDRSDVCVAAIDQLTELGQVKRHRDPTDGRRRIVELTTAGRRQLARLDRELDQAQESFLEPLPERERAALRASLQTLLDHHRNDSTPTTT